MNKQLQEKQIECAEDNAIEFKIDTLDNYSYTKLMWATKTDNMLMINELLTKNANPFIENGYNLSAFVIAIRNKNTQVVKQFLQTIQYEDNSQEADFYYSIGKAMLNENSHLRKRINFSIKSIKICFIEVCRISERLGKNISDLLELAKSTIGNVTIYSSFIDHIINEECVETKIMGDTIAQKIKKNINIDNVNDKDKYGDTPLVTATRYGLLDTINNLLILNADPTIKCSDGKTSLHYASFGGNLNILKILIKHFIIQDINDIKTNDLETLMHSAAYGIKHGNNGCWEIFEYLISENDMNPFTENNKKKTPRDILTEYVDQYDDLLEKLGCYV